MKTVLGAAAIVTALMLALVTTEAAVFASEGSAGSPAAGGLPQENTNTSTNLGYLFAIYIITWAGFFAYIFIVSRRQRWLEREIRNLRKLVTDRRGTEEG